MEQWEAMMGGKTFITDQRRGHRGGPVRGVVPHPKRQPPPDCGGGLRFAGPGGEIPDSRQPGVCPGVKRRQSDAG